MFPTSDTKEQNDQVMRERWLLSTFFPLNGKAYKLDDFVGAYHGKNHHGKNNGKDYGIYDPRFSFGRIRRLRHGKVLIEYLYWPEEVESGRQSYHSAWELIGSDHWQVVSVESLNLKTHSICDEPSNPDEPMFLCDIDHCHLLHHRSCLEKIYRYLFMCEVEILQGATVLRMKILRGEDFLISRVSCLQCGTPISLEDKIPEGSERDTQFFRSTLSSFFSPSFEGRAEISSVRYFRYAKKSPRGWEPKLLKAKYPWLKDNILKLLIDLAYIRQRTYRAQYKVDWLNTSEHGGKSWVLWKGAFLVPGKPGNLLCFLEHLDGILVTGV
ncbi:hypothetical protein DL98DRAFT_543072 [Cadophora sp. DSE1049]|nr:hypothetical protein DL98DRAFT_543072 [Cadophora sp. DSE1049]